MVTDYDRVAAAIEYLRDHAGEQPRLNDVAAAVHVSPFHFQRLFKPWAGVTPKQFLAVLTVDRAKTLLASDASILDAALEVGLSSPSRLHDHFVSIDAVTPGEYKQRGAGLAITYGCAESPFGECGPPQPNAVFSRLSLPMPNGQIPWSARGPNDRMRGFRAMTKQLATSPIEFLRAMAAPGATCVCACAGRTFRFGYGRRYCRFPPDKPRRIPAWQR